MIKLLLLLVTTASVFAQAPQKISYQSVIRSASNVLISNTTVGMKVSLLQGGSNGVAVYSETHTPTTNANGLVSLAIGTGTVVEGVFANVDWSTGSYFVKTEIDPIGGVNYSLIGTSELLSVPFALHAKTAPGTTAGEMLYWNGSAWVSVAPGITDQTLSYCHGVPTWGQCTPSITTIYTPSQSSDSASSGGNITSQGGSAVTARGVCWSTESKPVISGSHTVDGSGVGQFQSVLYDLTPNTTYYLRAYATNSIGTNYGNEIIFTTSETTLIEVGVPYQGGIIAYVDSTGLHGFIAAPNDSGYILRGPDLSNIIPTSTAIGTGESNTDLILGYDNTYNAAKFCYDLSLNGYDDWYLPSKDELLQLVNKRQIIGGFTEGSEFWSSSDYSGFCNARYSCAWSITFDDVSDPKITPKYFTRLVRAIRSF